MMKKIGSLFTLFVLFLLAGTVQAQIFDPVHWTFRSVPLGEGRYEVIFRAEIDAGWHLYSQNLGEGGPLPTEFYFEEPTGFILNGEVKENGKLEKEYVDVFEMDVLQYSHCVTFCQIVEAPSPGAVVKGGIDYMACSEGTCTPPLQKTFAITLQEGEAAPGACTCNATLPSGKPEERDGSGSIPKEDTAIHASVETTDTSSGKGKEEISGIISAFEDECGLMEGESHSGNMSLWAIFLAGFLGGLVALLTPCVFPIIPLTVSFFTKSSTTYRKGLMNALLYAACIMVIYVGLGLSITVLVGPQALNEMAANVIFNLAFFVIFVVFAISFFGAFEITLPSSWATKVDKLSGKCGLIGIFFMAFTLSIVSFSCTCPIIGTLLVETAVQGNIKAPLVGMSGFAFALALPFALFAAFPAWLSSLPRSGSWLNTVKVSLGFLELALALKFLSNADMAYHWGFLKREIFLGIWVIIFLLLSLYLIGILQWKRPGAGRISIGLAVLAFAAYLVPGLWGGSVALVSGFPPPEFYTLAHKKGESECPHNLNCFHDLEEGLSYAKEKGKPVMLDFTGWTCVNCRKMEEYVWSEPGILDRLSQEYVLISLYVDDRTVLPEAEQYYSEVTQRKIRTVGDKWSELQVRSYKRSAQPWYVLINADQELLADPRGYTPEADRYRQFLDEGLCRFGKQKSEI